MVKTKKSVNSKKIKVNGRIKPVEVSVAFNPMDAYQSPHRLDLSRLRFIEKTKPSASDSRRHFKFFSFEKSELLAAWRFCWSLAGQVATWGQAEGKFAPKLASVRGDNRFLKHSIIWQEVSLFNLATFILSGFEQFLSEFLSFWPRLWRRLMALKNKAGQQWLEIKNQKDEIFDFTLKTKPAILSKIKAERIILKKNGAFSGSQNILIGKKPAVARPTEQGDRLTLRRLFLNIGRKLNRFWRLTGELDFRGAFTPKILLFKSAAVAATLVAILVLPIKIMDYANRLLAAKGRVLGETEIAVKSLNLAKNQMGDFDFASAAVSFDAANRRFVSAQNQLAEIKSFLTILAETLPFSNTYKSGKNLIELGENLSLAGEHLLGGLSAVTANDQLLTMKIKTLSAEIALAETELEKAKIHLNKINNRHLPAENATAFKQIRESLPAFIASLAEIKKAAAFALDFLGDGDFKRYLLVFQNDNELRASGGFMGSFALVDFKNGEIKNIDLPAGGSYDLRAGLNELIKSPAPLWLVNARWEFQDANWWPDWPTSARNISWFYDKSGGPTVDGVVAVNSDWLARLLDLTGPIEMPDYQKTITAANYEEEIQKEVEVDYTDQKQPKKILGDLAPKLIDALLHVSADNFFDLVGALAVGLKEKDIMVYAKDTAMAQWLADSGWSGRQIKTDADYLLVTNTNIAGGKTDAVVRQKIHHQAEIGADGGVVDRLLINRYHFGPTENILTDFPNRTYFRIYVPLGSKLIKASGFVPPAAGEFEKPDDFLRPDKRLAAETSARIDPDSGTVIYDENGKTVFANWLVLNPGENRDVVISYEIPFAVRPPEKTAGGVMSGLKKYFSNETNLAPYSLIAEKQPGSDNEFQSEIVYADRWRLASFYPYAARKETNRLIFDYQEMTEDLSYSVNFLTD